VHVGLNAQLLDFSQTYRSGGISRYIYHLLAQLRTLATDDQFSASRPASAPGWNGRWGAVELADPAGGCTDYR